MKNRKSYKIIFTVLFLIFAWDQSLANDLYYTQLQNKDLEQMRGLLKPHLKTSLVALKNADNMASQAEREKLEAQAILSLRTALKIILSRPNKDNMTNKLLDEVQSRLTVLNMYMTSLDHLAISAITVLKNKNLPREYLATNVFILENLMSQIRPKLSNSKYMGIMQRIKNAEIDVPEKAIRLRRMRGMHKTISPSEIARQILKKDGHSKK
ncbi:MAG: hypothetical protein HOO06_16775 [Bdellovibrionaceae bacterium]|mgnify:CR=1 FL=1|jgi:hypothetical protein|nr:hypothetical protein [Pseudobdellovibrionaceae bacterium]